MTSDGGLISGRYRLGELLGTGGSASVFVAVDVESGAEVALKLLHPHLSESRPLRDAFFAEARRMQPLRAPNIVGVIGVGVGGTAEHLVAWIALERAAGTSLAEHVGRHGPLGVADALAVARGVLIGLEAAHGFGVIHRDVSPSNVIVAPGADGTMVVDGVRLLDFGLADAAGRAALGADVLRSDVGDRPSGVVGNVGYSSPEQLRGDPVDERGDVYQAGGVLYFALTGRAPYPRSSTAQTMRAHLEAPPPVASVMDSRIPRDVDRIVVRAMLKTAGDRFASASDMRAALDLVEVEAPVRTSSPELDTTRAEPVSPALSLDATRVLGSTRLPGPVPASEALTAVHQRGRGRARDLRHAPRPGSPAARSKRLDAGRRGVSAWVAGIATVAALSSIIAFAAFASTPTTLLPTPSASATPVVLPPSPAAPVEGDQQASGVRLPEFTMLSLTDARQAISEAGLVLGSLTVVDSGYAGDTVLGSVPAGGTWMDDGAVVDLTVASGSNTVPDVAGSTRASAVAAIQSAGFTVGFATSSGATVPTGAVIRSEPGSGAVLRLGTTVTIVEAVAVATPEPTPTPTPIPTPTPTPTPGAP